MLSRQIEPVLAKDLAKKMVFLAGPRQCGKTTLALHIAEKIKGGSHYYSWDIASDRKTLMGHRLDADAKLWVLDELHKYRSWRNWLKGQYDQHHRNHSLCVMGSAKLDAYSRGGDSLQGRYYFHRLHPLTLAEILALPPLESYQEVFSCGRHLPKQAQTSFETLLTLGGFPEPFLSGSEKEASRWRLAYGARLVHEEIRALEQVQALDKMELLYDRLPMTVGSVLSINSLREDLEVAFETIRNWLAIFERLYAIFRVAPFGAPRIKAVKKEQKLYFWDWAHVEAASARLENCVGLHLLRWVHWRKDVEGEKWELRYFRDTVGHEVDFILLYKGKPMCAVEVKQNDRDLDGNLKYLISRVKIPFAFQVYGKGDNDWEPPPINGCKIRILPAMKFLGQLV